MNHLLQDIRYAFRMLRRNPGFATAVVLALALGIGANTMIFSVLNGVLLRPLPYKEPDRLVLINETNVRRELPRTPASPPDFTDWQAQQQVFENIGAYSSGKYNLTGRDLPQTLQGQRVSANLFNLLGVNPTLGRAFLPEEYRSEGSRVVILSYGLWQRSFGSDKGVIGQPLNMNGVSYMVVGVMPAGLVFPPPIPSDQSEQAQIGELWTPLVFDDVEKQARQFRFLRVLGRLKPGVSVAQAQAEMSTIASRLEQGYPKTNTGWGVRVASLHKDIVAKVRPALLILFGAVGLILLIACANVANLLMARATARQNEIAIRTVLGAQRGRLVRQLLTESMVLAVLSGILGCALAFVGLRVLLSILPQRLALPRLSEIALDAPVLLFTLGISVLTAIIFGLIPAWQATRTNLNEALKEGGRTKGGGVKRKHMRNALMVSEIALALVLLIGASLMIKSFFHLLDVKPGFNPENLLTMDIYLPPSKYTEAPQMASTYKQVLAQLDGTTGVQSAAMISSLPLGGGNAFINFAIEGQPPTTPLGDHTAAFRFVSPSYFQTMGVPQLKGRTFNERDTVDAPAVIIIDQAMALRFWPNQDPIGKRISIMGEPFVSVAGVVGSVKHTGLDADVGSTVYLPYSQLPAEVMTANGRQMTLIVRTAQSPQNMTETIRQQIRSVDKDQPVFNFRLMEDVLLNSVSQQRFYMVILGIFAFLALLLAAIGVYGVISYSVTQRTNEIGIRMALGAQQRDMLKLVVGQGMFLTAIGVVIGLAASFLLTRIIGNLLFGVSTSDPTVFISSSLLLALIAVIATYIPAQRAAKVDPLVALRYE